MRTLIIQTDTPANAKFQSLFLKTVSIVKSVRIGQSEPNRKVNPVNEPAAEYNWTNPSRPATDEEIEQMLDECEKGPSYTSGEVMDLIKTELKEWRKKKK